MNEDSIEAGIYVANNEDVRQKWQSFIEGFKYNPYFAADTHDLIAIYINSLIEDEPLRIYSDEVFYRARINETIPYKAFNDNELGSPPADKVGFGRLNPSGISYLYIAYEEETAVSEIRPYVGAKVNIAKCMPDKVLKVLDLTRSNGENRKQNFRKMLSELFSQPVVPGMAEQKYVPTQYIAKYIKGHEFDGVKYQSSINSSKSNICLFNSEDVRITYFRNVEVANTNVVYE